MRRLTLALAALLLCAGTGATAATGPHLQIPAMSPRAAQLPAGITKLDDGAIAYRSATLPDGPRPLLILLHGAGEPPEMLVDAFRAAADERGLILLAPKSAGDTWDAIGAVKQLRTTPTGRDAERLFDGDATRVESAMREIGQRTTIATKQIVIGGHSDGASYALSLGLWNPRLFRGIMALSPGGLLAPEDKDRGQRVFIAHGRSDRVVAIQHDEQLIAEPLTAAGLNVRFRSFDGGHRINPASISEGLAFVLPK